MQTPLGVEVNIDNPAIAAFGAAAAVLAAGYATFVRMPSTPYTKVKIYPGLKSLEGPETAIKDRLRDVYPEDTFPDPQYAPLQYGKIKYHRFGYEYGHKVVLITGISIPSIIWKEVMPVLSKHFNILVFDHYGRGYSDAPDVTYNSDFFANEVAQLMQFVGWTKAKILGVSMGGGIAVAFARAYPHLVDEKIGLVAPVGLMSASDIPLASRILMSPLLQSVIQTNFVRGIMAKMYKPEDYPDWEEDMQRLQQIVLPGHLMAICSSARDGPLRGLEDDYVSLGESGFKVGLFWGTNDVDVPYRLATEVLKRVPDAKFVTIPGGTHGILQTHSEFMGKALYEFLK